MNNPNEAQPTNVDNNVTSNSTYNIETDNANKKLYIRWGIGISIIGFLGGFVACILGIITDQPEAMLMIVGMISLLIMTIYSLRLNSSYNKNQFTKIQNNIRWIIVGLTFTPAGIVTLLPFGFFMYLGYALTALLLSLFGITLNWA